MCTSGVPSNVRSFMAYLGGASLQIFNVTGLRSRSVVCVCMRLCVCFYVPLFVCTSAMRWPPGLLSASLLSILPTEQPVSYRGDPHPSPDKRLHAGQHSTLSHTASKKRGPTCCHPCAQSRTHRSQAREPPPTLLTQRSKQWARPCLH